MKTVLETTSVPFRRQEVRLHPDYLILNANSLYFLLLNVSFLKCDMQNL